MLLASGLPAHGQSEPVPSVFPPSYFSDTLPADTLKADTLAIDSAVVHDSTLTVEDTTWARFLPPSRWQTAEQYRTEELLAGPQWPMPPVDAIAGGDLADWLSYHPAYDVADAPGVGQPRFFTHWGLVDRVGLWQVDGRTASWQRLTLPMTPQFDPAILPSFDFTSLHFGEEAILRHDTGWSERPTFDFTFRQGDFSDTYSEGRFRARTKRGFGLDAGATFFSSDGRFAADNRDKRILSLEAFGPLRKQLYWRARYSQFRDKSLLLPPAPYDLLRPVRNDLLWSGEVALAHGGDSIPLWQFGARFVSGAQRLSDPSYAISSEDRSVQLFGQAQIMGWHFDLFAGGEQLEIDSTTEERGIAGLSIARRWDLSDAWEAALGVSAGSRLDEPIIPGFKAALSPRVNGGMMPHLRLSRQGTTHTMFDLHRPLAEFSIIDAMQTGYIYSEAGDPDLDDQWENSIGVQWGSETFADSIALGWTVAGHAAYIENYTLWNGVEDTDTLLGNPVPHLRYRPRAEDARSLGAAVGLHGRLFWKLHFLTHYAVKYATNLDNEKLTGYYPHKGVAMVSLIAPKWKYNVDVRLNAAGLWWYGDTRIDPSGYEASHVFRFDLSGTARVVGDLTLFAMMQNVANFPYRSAAGFPLTGRTLRFGLHVTLYD
jgi:hypothetical protein